MPLEVEAKFPCPRLDRVRQRLHALGAKRQGRVFERNLVLDDAGGNLRERGMLLRLRRDGNNLVTVKLPPEDDPRFKVVREYEIRVDDFEAARELFAALGFHPSFAYEKVRETFELDGCHVLLDTLPFGDFVEIEGERSVIGPLAERLGLDLAEAGAENYHQLNLEARKRQGLPPEDGFVFDPSERERLLAELD